MSAADKIEVGQYWQAKANGWIQYVVTGLTNDGWVRYMAVGGYSGYDHLHPEYVAAQYARSVEDFLNRYERVSEVNQDEPPF